MPCKIDFQHQFASDKDLRKCLWHLLVLLSFHAVSAQPSQKIEPDIRSTIYQDIFLQQTPQTWVFGNNHIAIEVNKNTGAWIGLGFTNIPGELIQAQQLYQTVDFKIDTTWMVENHGATLLRQSVHINNMREGVNWELTFGILLPSAQANSYSYELRCRYTLFPGKAQLNRSASVLRNAGPHGPTYEKFTGFAFKLPDVVVGNAADCVMDVPGPFFPKTFLAPETPYQALGKKYIQFHNAPDAGFGILAVSNKKLSATLISWIETQGEVNYNPFLNSDGKQVNLGFTTDRAYQMPVNFSATSDIHHLELVPSLKAGLESYRQMCEKQMPLDTQTPASIREMVLLEIYPEYFPEGFKGITSKLSFYKDVGFNTIYLMPHWKGGYSPIDFYTVDPRFGTSQDLKEMVRMAHSLGMKVFFDMVIHGFNEKSPVTTQRPDIFVKDEQGKLARHPMWKSITTDWANPAYKQYMADLALYDVKTYDIDGYRLDAATYKGPSWEPNLSYPAYLSGTAAPELMERMLEAMHTVKPEAVMLSEVFGPVFYTVSNLVHDNQTEGPQFLLEKMEKGEYTAYDYKIHMQHVFSALPKGANRVYFARNHDTSWFYHFNGYTPRFMAMEAIHALCAIPEVFAGDPKNKPNPDDDKAVFEHYKKLFSLRKDYPELARGELLLEEVETNNPMVFTALRRMYGKITLVTVSLSDKEENVQITVPEKTVKGNINLIDGLSRQTIKSSLTNTGKIEIKLKPYQVIVGRLNAGAETRMNK